MNRAGYRPADWNELNATVVALVETEIVPVVAAVAERLRLGEKIVEEVRLQMSRALVESQFAEANIYSLGITLLKVYEAGHFPCGWESNLWPDGQLVVL